MSNLEKYNGVFRDVFMVEDAVLNDAFDNKSVDGWDSVLSILQMPSGIPVATVALDGAKNAAILAAQIIGTGDPAVMEKVVAFKTDLASKIEKANRELKEIKYRFKVD